MHNIFNIRLISVLVISTVLIMSIFVGVRFYLSKLEFDRNLDVQVEQIANRIASSVKPSIWSIYSKSIERSFSEEFASAVLDSELNGDYVAAIVVYGRFGHIYMGKLKNEYGVFIPYNDSLRPSVLQKADLIRDFPIKFNSMTLGKVELFIDTSVFEQKQRDALIIEFIQIGLVSVFFVLVLFYAIKRTLMGPMGRLQVARKAFDSMGEAIAFTNAEGVIYDTNPAFRSITKLMKDDAQNKNINDFFPGKLEKMKSRESGNFFSSWEGETECQYGSDTSIPVWLTISSVESSRNKDIITKEFVFLFQDISSRKEAEQKLEKLAFFDPLTDLPNRQYFENELETSIHAVSRSHSKIGLIFLDLDHFKHVNDTLGHAAGDEVLVKIARRFKSRIREADFLSRVGGDEFTVLVRDISDSQQVASLAIELNKIAAEPIIVQGIEFKSGASIGVSMYPDDASTASELVKNADIAMYHAKEKGRDQFSFYSEDLNGKVERYFALKNKLDLALIKQEFELYYQPKMDLFENRIVAAEGLIRWASPDGEIIRPDVFIPLAEETRQIIPIGQWVIEQAVEQLARWSNTRFSNLGLSVNLSPVQLYDEHLITFLTDVLNSQGVDAAKLEIEITESAIIQDAEKAVEVLHKIKALGIKLSLDDFGTGYSSLSHLRMLPVDTLKIDRSFMVGAKQGNDSGAILTSIIKLAEMLSIDVVAEGIEDQQHLDFLKSQKCLLGQGYYFSPPVTLSEFQKLDLAFL